MILLVLLKLKVLEPDYLFSELNEMFTCFDILAKNYRCERIKTIGDAYLAVTNVNIKNEDQLTNLAKFARCIIDIIKFRKSNINWQCRIIYTRVIWLHGIIVKQKSYMMFLVMELIDTRRISAHLRANEN